VETIGRLGARLILRRALEDEVTKFLGRPAPARFHPEAGTPPRPWSWPAALSGPLTLLWRNC
jgi:hypothetical protein